MARVCLALGTNLGDREENLRQALKALAEVVSLEQLSCVYTTAPKYVLDQPAFLNMCVRGETQLPAPELLSKLKGIEDQQGRVSSVRFGPRLIDLDIVFYDDSIIALSDLEVPHPRMAERRFVLQPLNDVAANWIHPVTLQTVSQMLDALPVQPDEDGDGPDVILYAESL